MYRRSGLPRFTVSPEEDGCDEPEREHLANLARSRGAGAGTNNVKRTVRIALTVGSVFFAMNQLGTIMAGHAGTIVWLKAVLTYLTPLIVSNVGVLSTTRRVD